LGVLFLAGGGETIFLGVIFLVDLLFAGDFDFFLGGVGAGGIF